MPPKKDNLPVNVDVDLQNGGTITYANEVIAIIAGVAANEIDGIAGMCTSGGIGDIIGRNRNITRGVRVEIGSEEASVDIYAIVEYGKPIYPPALDRTNREGQLDQLTTEVMCQIAAMLPEKYHGFYRGHPRLLQILAEKQASHDAQSNASPA